jgi:hypothetical protein
MGAVEDVASEADADVGPPPDEDGDVVFEPNSELCS